MSLPKQRIIDCHFHPAVDAATRCGWFQDCGDARRQIEELRRAGITQACGAPFKTLSSGSFAEVRDLNNQALLLRDKFPEFYIPGIHIHSRFPEESCREIERCCGGEGVRWIGELLGQKMGYGDEYATDDALVIMRVAAAHKAAVNIHCEDLAIVERLCRMVPDLKVVLAHPGGGKDVILNRAAKVAAFPNLHLDISGSGIDRLGILRKLCDTAGKEKILFGTDYPINNPAVYVQGVLFEDLSEPERAAIFCGNFLRLTGA